MSFADLAAPYAVYYDRYYPYAEIVRWLMRDGRVDPAYREWSYETLLRIGETFVSRFRSVETSEDLRKLLCFHPDTASSFLLKLDIGPIYSHPMGIRDSAGSSFVSVERELVFDIDAGDFDRVRTCCQEASICPKCWRFMELVVPLLVLFANVNGFNDYFFVFSGRRGLHAWMYDDVACRLTREMRLSLLQSIQLVAADTGTFIDLRYDRENWLCTLIYKEVCKPFFIKMLVEQDWLGGSVGDPTNALHHIRETERVHLDQNIQVFIKNAVLLFNNANNVVAGGKGTKGRQSDLEKFDQALEGFIRKLVTIPNVAEPEVSFRRWELLEKELGGYPDILERLVVYYTYPRFDIEVTRTMNHLLKVPFSVHRKTCKISVPFPIAPIYREYGLSESLLPYRQEEHAYASFPRFVPDSAPTIIQLQAGETQVYDTYLDFFRRMTRTNPKADNVPPIVH
ncbi:DNA primase small subunit [Giardia muris]|uniref:DNA primase n=1 Tax=Giardia muris TaxID=5742 RepID=A0A4Z1SR11_GIAMU|nr:DNA primase small subunit [Giardia muris]|eukprot:TNJ27395.1 DNA primase small subunit [Giardia muris]